MSDAPETRVNRGGDFSNIYKRDHFVESGDGRWEFARKRGELRATVLLAFPSSVT